MVLQLYSRMQRTPFSLRASTILLWLDLIIVSSASGPCHRPKGSKACISRYYSPPPANSIQFETVSVIMVLISVVWLCEAGKFYETEETRNSGFYSCPFLLQSLRCPLGIRSIGCMFATVKMIQWFLDTLSDGFSLCTKVFVCEETFHLGRDGEM